MGPWFAAWHSLAKEASAAMVVCVYLLRVGLLPLGIDTVGLWGGVLLIISGILNILIHALLPVHPYNFYTRRASDPEDEEEGVFNE